MMALLLACRPPEGLDVSIHTGPGIRDLEAVVDGPATFRWLEDGVDVGVDGRVVPADRVWPGSTWRVEVTVPDGRTGTAELTVPEPPGGNVIVFLLDDVGVDKVGAYGGDFAALAREYSDGPSGPTGGDLGVWTQGRMVPEFDQAILAMDIGDVSDPVETGFGYHIIMRKKVEKVSARHILVMHVDSMRKPAEITRTKEEALVRINEVKQKIDAGSDFAAMAREYSDGPTGPNGGDLGSFGRGRMHPAFEEAAFGLEVGGVSGPVETPFGYHLIQRYK